MKGRDASIHAYWLNNSAHPSMATCELKVTVLAFMTTSQKFRLGGLGFAAGAQLFVGGWWI
jgi:hypothetical protein